MAEVRWLVQPARSEHVIITAPDAPVGTGAAVARLEAALSGFAGSRPAWFRPLERLGYWWYPICIVTTAGVFAVAAPGDPVEKAFYGLGAGVAVAVFSGWIITALAHLQARLTSGRTVAQTIKDVAALARPAGGVADRVEAMLAWDPAREREVHELAWKAAGVGRPDRWAANEALDELWKQADPAAAAERDAKLKEIQAALEAHKRGPKR